MNVVDVSILVLLGGSVLAGFWFGAIHMVGSVVGMLAATVVAGRFQGVAAGLIRGFVGGNENLARLIAFFLLFVLTTRLVGLLFWAVERAFRFFAIIPFMKTFNRLLGAVLGLLEGTLALGIAVWFAARFPVSAPFESLLAASRVAKALAAVGGLLAPLLPAALRAVQSAI